MNENVIQIENVGKEFKTDFWKQKVAALKGISFDVRRGEIFGLVGPNGAGKTTALKILMGLLRPTSGQATLLGTPVWENASRRELGYLPENAYYYDFLRTEEVLDFYGRLFGLGRRERRRRSDELLEMVGLSKRKGLKLRNYSKGMLQRIGIAQALVNDPALVILDEPMSGLDPVGRKEVRDIILGLAKRGKTILFSSHILSDVEALCDRVVILMKGEVRAYGDLAELVRPAIQSVEIVFQGTAPAVLPEAFASNVELRVTGDKVVLTTADVDRVVDLVVWGRSNGLSLLSVDSRKDSLEDLFMKEMEEGS